MRRADGRTVIIILYPHSRMNVSWLPTIGMGYDIECHIGSDISNNGRWRKDSGFDVQIQGASPAHIQGVPIKLALPALSKKRTCILSIDGTHKGKHFRNKPLYLYNCQFRICIVRKMYESTMVLRTCPFSFTVLIYHFVSFLKEKMKLYVISSVNINH